MKTLKALVSIALLASLPVFAQSSLPNVMPDGIYSEPDSAAQYLSPPPGRRAQFRTRLNAALQRNPKNPVLLSQRAYFFQQGGDLAEASRDFSKALVYAEPHSLIQRNVLWSLGWAHYDQGEYEDALSAWRRAVAEHGGRPFWQAYSFALLYWSAGEKELALAWYSAAVEANGEWGVEAGFAERTKYWRPAQRERMRALFDAWKKANNK